MTNTQLLRQRQNLLQSMLDNCAPEDKQFILESLAELEVEIEHQLHETAQREDDVYRLGSLYIMLGIGESYGITFERYVHLAKSGLWSEYAA